MRENSMKFFGGCPSKMAPMILLFAFSRLGHPVLADGEFRLQIVHNSDLHARFEQVNAHYGFCTEEEARRGKCYGGFARIKTAIEMAKTEVESERIPTVVLNAGDFFVGTAYYELKKWELTAPMVRALQYDVITLGNHDFDDGIENVVNFINHVRIPVVCCNLDLKTEPRLAVPNLKPSHILNVSGTEIGVIGFVTPTTMELSLTENLIILDEIPCIRAEVAKLKENGVKIIIALSHSGFKEDILIAKNVPELSLIVGGHTHLLLHTPEEENESTKNGRKVYKAEDSDTRIVERPDIEKVEGEYPYKVQLPGKWIPIVHAHAFTKYLGKVIATFDVNGNVTSTTGNTVILDSTIPEDETTKNFTESLIGPLRPMVKAPIAYTRVPLQLVNFDGGEFESTLGNLVTDALVDFAARKAAEAGSKEWTKASIALLNTPSLCQELGHDGRISLEDVMSSFMPGNNVIEVTYPGSVLKDALERSMVPESIGTRNFNNFLYVSGLRVVYDLSQPIGQRVESVEALCADCVVPRYENLKMNKNYKVILPMYLWKTHPRFPMLRSSVTEPVTTQGLTLWSIVRHYLQRMKVVYPFFDGRVKVKYPELV